MGRRLTLTRFRIKSRIKLVGKYRQHLIWPISELDVLHVVQDAKSAIATRAESAISSICVANVLTGLHINVTMTNAIRNRRTSGM
jgi:hypothetical protein